MDDISAEFRREPAACHDDDDEEEQEAHRKGIKRLRLPLATPWYGETSKETGFHQSARLCLSKIRDCLFEHRWQDASEYMTSYFQTLEDTSTSRQLLTAEIIWRLGTEILHHLSKSKLEDFNHFFDLMKNTGVKGYLKVCLEHSFHLLLMGRFDDASRQLSRAESWRFGKHSASQIDRMKLIHAYRGFLSYITWVSKKGSLSGTDDGDVSDTQEMHSYFRQASVSLQEILKQPGVWDPFVISYVDMLEFYNDHEGALNVLKEYAYNSRFPNNPNAHVYLYGFLKRHNAPQKKLIRVLQILAALVPSHELMLELFSLLLQSGSHQHLEQALGVIFNLLDDCSWKQNLEAWTCLGDVIKVLQREKLKHFLEKEWVSRTEWWPAFHFRTYHARKDFKLSRDLVTVKAFVAAALTGNKCMYCRRKNQLFEEEKKKLIVAKVQQKRTR